MSYEQFLTKIRRHAAFESDEQAAGAARVVLAVLSSVLPRALRADMRQVLPASLADALSEGAETPPFESPDHFFKAIGHWEHVPVGFAIEHASVVCQALSELLEAELETRLRAAVGPGLAPLFEAREHTKAPPKPVHGDRRTISTSRPGGLHPVSDAGGDARGNTLASGRPGGATPVSEAESHPESQKG